jgi:Plavaka transposase
MSSFLYQCHGIFYTLFYTRCDAKWDNLDDNIAGRRSHKLTCSLVAALDKNSLWDDYGIVSDIMVCNGSLSNSCRRSLRVSQPFTHGFPRADIHELLSPDLLHQIIKGTFKDHLVTWVTDYIKLEHPPAEAKQILADIDRR